MKSELDLTYTGSFGTLKANSLSFVPYHKMKSMLEMDLEGLTSALSEFPYSEDISALSGTQSGHDLLEMAVNRRLAKRNFLVMRSAPGQVLDFIQFYLSKWDIDNLKSIISSKLVGLEQSVSDTFLLSFRDVPMGVFGGMIPHEVYRSIIQAGSLEQIIESASSYHAGRVFLSQLEIYKKHKDVSMFFSAVDSSFNNKLITMLKFFRGDEWIARRYFNELMSARNVDVVLKARTLGLKFEVLKGSFAETTVMGEEKLFQIYSSSEQDLIQNIGSAFGIRIPGGYEYDADLSLALWYGIRNKYLQIMSSTASSLNFIMWFLIKSEVEREKLRGIINGKRYSLDRKRIIALTGLAE